MVSMVKSYVRTINVDGSAIVCTQVDPWADTFEFRHPMTNARTLFCTLSLWEDSMRDAIRERLTRA